MTGVDLPAMLHLSTSSSLISSISSAFSLGTPRSRQCLAAALLAASVLPGVASAQADAPTSPASLSTKTARESRLPPAVEAARSEEHTSELQSPCNLVCRLLLETIKMHVP